MLHRRCRYGIVEKCLQMGHFKNMKPDDDVPPNGRFIVEIRSVDDVQ